MHRLARNPGRDVPAGGAAEYAPIHGDSAGFGHPSRGWCPFAFTGRAWLLLVLPLTGEGSTGSRRPGPCRAWGPMFCTSAASPPTAPRAPGSGRLGITSDDSVTNAARCRNDLLMMVSDEE